MGRKWPPGGSALLAEPPGADFRNYSCKRLTSDCSAQHCMLPRMLLRILPIILLNKLLLEFKNIKNNIFENFKNSKITSKTRKSKKFKKIKKSYKEASN